MPEIGLEQRVARLEGRLEGFEGRFDRLEGRIDGRHDALDAKIDARFQTLDGKIDSLREEFSDTMATNFRWIVGLQVTVLVTLVAALLVR